MGASPLDPPDEMPEHTAEDHLLNSELLGAELPDPRFVDAEYLRWLYELNPCGRAFWANADEEGRRVAHYAVIPQEYRCSAGSSRMVFSLNAVTRSGVQRRGWFTTLGERIYGEAAEWGAKGVIGVSNRNSTPPVVRKLGFRLLGPLPVMICPGTGRHDRSTVHAPVNEEWLSSSTFDEVVGGLDEFPVQGWVNSWNPQSLRWRLSAPNVASRYWVHAGNELFAVTARERFRGLPIPVILKLLPRTGSGRPAAAGPLVAAICRFHRTPWALYAGFNRHVRIRGLPLPMGMRPSPLNLIFRSLDPDLPNESLRLDIFEFLDMDAY